MLRNYKIKFVSILCLLSLYSLSVAATPSSKDIQTMIRNADEQGIAKLINEGADFIEIQKQSGNRSTTILDITVYFNQVSILQMLLKHQPEMANIYGGNALVTACATNKKFQRIIKILLDAGVDINAKNKAGKTCLFRAALAADDDFFKALLDLGADPKIKVEPDKVLKFEGPVTIEEFVKIRSARYDNMLKHISQQ